MTPTRPVLDHEESEQRVGGVPLIAPMLSDGKTKGIFRSTSCKYRALPAPATTDSCDTPISRTDVPFRWDRVLWGPATKSTHKINALKPPQGGFWRSERLAHV